MSKQINELSSTHSWSYTVTESRLISKLLFVGLVVAIICAGTKGGVLWQRKYPVVNF